MMDECRRLLRAELSRCSGSRSDDDVSDGQGRHHHLLMMEGEGKRSLGLLGGCPG